MSFAPQPHLIPFVVALFVALAMLLYVLCTQPLRPGPQPAPDPEPPPARPRAWTCSSGENLARAELKRERRKNTRQAERIERQAKWIAELKERLYLLAEDSGKRICDLEDEHAAMLEVADLNDGEYHVLRHEADTLRASLSTLGDHIRQICAVWEHPDANGRDLASVVNEARAATNYQDYRPGPNDPPFPPEPEPGIITFGPAAFAPPACFDLPTFDPDGTDPVADPDAHNPVRPPTGDPQPGVTRTVWLPLPARPATGANSHATGVL